MNKDVVRFHKVVVFGMKLLQTYLEDQVATYQKIVDNPQDVMTETHKENLALLQRELLHISHTAEYLKANPPKDFATPAEYRDYLMKNVEQYNHDRGVPHACTVIVNDKINDCYTFFSHFISE